MLYDMEVRLLNILDDHFFGYNSTRLQDLVFKELADRDESMSLIEIQTDGEVLDSLAHEISHQEAFKGGLYFTQNTDATNYFEMTENEKGTKEANEELDRKSVV